MFQLSFVSAGNGNSKLRNATNKIGGAIQWVDNPLILGIFWAVLTKFFTDKTMSRVSRFNLVDNGFF